MAIIICVVNLPRLSPSPFPAWLERYVLLDTGSKAYMSLILLHHTNCHPVFRTAAWEMETDTNLRRLGPANGYVSAAKRKVSNRFNLLWMMHKNPSLVPYRKHSLKRLAKDFDETVASP